MAQVVVSIGIDVSKDRLDVYVRPHKLRFSVANDDSGHDELIARLADWPGGKRPKVVIVACMRKLIVTLNAIARDATPWNAQKSAT